MKIPYGVADFYSLRTAGQVYVDRTDRIALLEELGERLLFLRPRRFGKSLWLSTLAAYYDLRHAGEHERLFGDLAIGRLAPGGSVGVTPFAHRYFVLRWDFSDIDPDSPLSEGPRVRRIGVEIHRYLNNSVKSFASDFREHLPEAVEIERDAFSTLENLLAVVRQTPYRLYLLIDEYDNFANEVAADEGKLEYLAQATAGQDAVVDLIRREKPLEIRQLLDRFTLRTLLERSFHDASFLGSYLFYFGMLTLKRGRTATRTLELLVPNEVVRGLYLQRIRGILMPAGASRTAADEILFTFLRDGDLLPLLDFIEATLFPTLSNRDAVWANELTVKTVFLTLLWNETAYITHSEPELDHGYADLCLLRRPDVQSASLWDLLFEFKRLSLKELGMSGKDVRAASRKELMEHELVKDALEQAETQIAAYRVALERSRGETLKLRSYTVVALGFERLVVRPDQTSG